VLSFVLIAREQNYVADHGSEKKDLQENPAETYEQWRRRKARVEKNYRIARGFG